MAARLSEDAKRKVLLLEAGGEENSHPDGHVPYKCGSLQLSHIDWKYLTVPQKYSCFSLIDQVGNIHKHSST